MKEAPLGLLLYPVLQSADILLYKAKDVPVGEDNLQSLEISRYLARNFNRLFKKDFFEEPVPRLNEYCKIKGLRNPIKKMSKSDPDPKSCLYVNDSSKIVFNKIKKAVTDCNSQITFDPEKRPGVANLLRIQSAITGLSVDEIVSNHSDIDTGKFKHVVAETLVEHLAPIQKEFEYLIKHPDHLESLMESGNKAASEIAENTMIDVRKLVGLTNKLL